MKKYYWGTFDLWGFDRTKKLFISQLKEFNNLDYIISELEEIDERTFKHLTSPKRTDIKDLKKASGTGKKVSLHFGKKGNDIYWDGVVFLEVAV
jgi:hypothetical protein